jgi:2-polyprenyl-3-methyl-5-hydroxy-6-metoxy-1,4-benzoquinol methylase
MNKFDKEYFQQRYATKVLGVSADIRRAYLYKARLRMLDRLGFHPEIVIELGCGTGGMTQWLAKKYSKIIATDISEVALHFCRSRLKMNNVSFVQTDTMMIGLRDGIADIVMAFDLVEHLPKPDLCFAEANRLMRHGGLFFISTPNPNSLGSRIKGTYPEYRSLPLAERKRQWFGWQDDSHITILSRDAWRRKLTDAGFEIVLDGSDYWWDAPYLEWLPALPQEIICKLVHRVLTRIRYFAPWDLGENYIAIARKVCA